MALKVHTSVNVNWWSVCLGFDYPNVVFCGVFLSCDQLPPLLSVMSTWDLQQTLSEFSFSHWHIRSQSHTLIFHEILKSADQTNRLNYANEESVKHQLSGFFFSSLVLFRTVSSYKWVVLTCRIVWFGPSPIP